MADARHRYWHRVGPAAVATSALLVGLAAPGCDDGGSTSTGGSAGTAGTGGTAGTAGTAGQAGSSLSAVPVAPSSGALDSTPDSTGKDIYFTGIRNGEPGIFKVDDKGTITDLFINVEDEVQLLGAPFGISISSDDSALFVADTGFDVTPGEAETAVGAILTLGTSPGTPTVVTGTEGYKPRGLDVHAGAEGDTLYFTGTHPTTGEAGVFSLPAAGGGVTKVASGAPFVNPSGVAVGNERIFVTDALASNDQLASLILIDKGGTASVFVDAIGVGYPAGVALSADEKTVYVSGVDLKTHTDNVLVIDIASKMVTPFIGQGLNENTDSGGLHRARGTDVFSWCDLTSTGGVVFRISFTP